MNTPTITVYCCRAWEVMPLLPVGRCGYCGQRPKWKDVER